MPSPVSMNLARSFALSPVCSTDPSTPTLRSGSVAAARAKLYAQGLGAPRSEVSIYKGVSDGPMGWKRRKSAKKLSLARESELHVQRWDGRNRMASPWDGSRRDQELWYPNGDCLIYLFAAGTSRRGHAFRIPFEYLLRADCGCLLTRHLSGYSSTDSSPVSSTSDNASYLGLPVIPQNGQYDLYIPAPPATRNQTVRQHIRTRNFFAWVCEKPLVGENLGQALVDLLETMREWRSEGTNSLEDLMGYMDQMGYNDMGDAPEHAVAMLVFAEHIKDEVRWAEAFSHVVGMRDACVDCAGYTALSLSTRSLITIARYSLTLRLHNVSTSLATFLDEQLSPSHVSLSDSNLEHLEHFRDFLHTYWMSVFGYYPPIYQNSEAYAFTKPLLYQMSKQFQALYDYLVDRNFQPQDSSPDAARRGLCVLQSVQAFDSCGRYEPLKYPLPHLPEPPKISKQSISFGILMGKKDRIDVDPRLASLLTVNKASNAGKLELLQPSLVKAFRLFEKQSIFADAKKKKKGKKKAEYDEVEKRKVRWLLVYGIIQTLRTVAEVDEMVKDVDRSVDYFLCSKSPLLPWLVAGEATPDKPMQQHNAGVTALMQSPSNASSSHTGSSCNNDHASSTRPTTAESSPMEPKMKIEPDIDHVALLRRNSHATNEPMLKSSSTILNTIPMTPVHRRASISISLPDRPHLRLRTQSLPTLEPIRISPTSPVRSKGTINRALSSLGNMPKLQQPKPVRPNSAILVAGYGNGTGEVCVGWEGQEELRRLKRSSISSGESTYGEDVVDTENEADYVRRPLSPAHGYEGCISDQSSEANEDVLNKRIDIHSDSTATSLSRSRSVTEYQDKPLPPAPSAGKTHRPKVIARRPSETIHKELGNRMSKARFNARSIDVSSEEESESDDGMDLEEIEFGKKVKKREMLTLLEALALDVGF